VDISEGHTGLITSVAWMPDINGVVFGYGYGAVQLWNAKTGESIAVLESRLLVSNSASIPSTSRVSAVACSPCGTRIVSATAGGIIRIHVWDSSLRLWIHNSTFNAHSAEVESITFSEHGTCVVSKSVDGAIGCWEYSGAPKSTPCYRYTLSGDWAECVSASYRRKVCWLPTAARLSVHFMPTITADSGDYLAIGNSEGTLTILDFSNCTRFISPEN